MAGKLGATYFIPTLVVPLLLITHGLAFRILLQHQSESAMRESWQPGEVTGEGLSSGAPTIDATTSQSPNRSVRRPV
jgi:hypothetical protein